MAAKGGKREGAGRKPNVPNKLNAEIKDMIHTAFNTLGGADYLVEQGKENPVAFMTLLGKVIPKDIKADVNIRTVLKRIDLTGGDVGPSD